MRKIAGVVVGVALLLAGFKAMPARKGSTESKKNSESASAAAESQLNPAQQQIVAYLRTLPHDGKPRGAVCCAPGTPQELVDALETALYTLPEYLNTTTWTGQQATMLRWSLPPDGTSVPSFIGEPSGTSSLFSTLNTQFGGNTALWQSLIAQCFQRWDDLTGISYTQVGDDGAAFFGAPGSDSAPRGDCRVSMKFIDGPSGILAYDPFPPTGDMVLDSADFWANSTNNYRFFRNVVTHEHGHGIGLLHVCPYNATKLMEPFIFTSSDGPQQDDIRGAQHIYGDDYEPNNTPATAYDLGSLDGVALVQDASVKNASDPDYYAFTVGPGMQAALTMTPVGSSYTYGPQGSCGSPVSVNGAAVSNLGLELRTLSGTTLASSTAAPAGVAEVIPNTILPPEGGTFLAYVIPGASSDVQRYTLQIVVSDLPGATIVSANPPTTNPYLAGQPFRDVLQTGSDTNLTQGIGGAGTPAAGGITYSPIAVTFNSTPLVPLTPAGVIVACTGGNCPTATAVTGSGAGPYQITLSGPIPPTQCTTFTFAGTAPGQKLQYQSLPGDTNLDYSANTQDLLALVQALNDGTANLPANLARYNINRSSEPSAPVNTQDLLREVQLLNGANTTQAFNGASVALCP
ncbi:MAG TPA: matrixin family metalloprotease [Phycisphaerae bacterium]|jgi:hypothetical protein